MCHSGGRVKRRNTRSASANLFCQGSLWGEFHFKLAAQHLLLEQRVFAHVRRHHFSYLARLKEYPETKTIDAAVV